MKVFLTLVSALSLASAADWAYKGEKGPANWKGGCTGNRQSPIDLPTGNGSTSPANFEPFTFYNYDEVPEQSYLENTGYTLKMSLKSKKVPMISGGGFSGKYKFAQFHFHWGMDDKFGSEHTIGGKSYPMELHLVHFNLKYGDDLGAAVVGGTGKPDTLAVLGIMFQIQEKDNPKLNSMVDILGAIEKPRTKNYTKLFEMREVLPADVTHFYRYEGSLTTPGCNEIVLWTVFKEPLGISAKQMNKIRKLSKANPPMQDNYRPVMPLNGRLVFDVTAGAEKMAGNSNLALALCAVFAAALLQ